MDIAGLSASTLALASNVPGTTELVAAPSNATTERFNAIMSASDPVQHLGATSAIAATNPSSHASVAPSLTGADTLGNQILSALQSASSQYAKAWHDTKTRLDGVTHQESISDMLRLQSDMLQMSVQYELVGKAVARSTQNVDTLVRMS